MTDTKEHLFAAALLVAILLTTMSPLHGATDPDRFLEDAKAMLERGELKSAVIQLKNALQQDPAHVESRLLLGQTYLRLGGGAAAEKEFDRARQLHVARMRWETDLAEAYLLQRKFREVLDELQVDSGEPPAYQASVLSLRGQAQLALGQTDAAQESFAQALQQQPDYAPAMVGEVRVAIVRQDLEQATARLEEVLARDPQNIDALLIRGDLARQRGESKKAIEDFSRVLEVAPENVQGLLGRAASRIASGEVEQAAADLDSVDRSRPGIPMTSYLRGLIAVQAKQWDVALEQLEQVLSIAPSHLQSQWLYGLASYAKGNLQTADEYLSRVVAAAPENFQAIKLLGATRLKLKRPAKAIEVLEPATEKKEDAQLLALLGSAYMAHGDQVKGAEALSRAVELEPNLAALRTQLAVGLLAEGETDAALSQLRSAVDLGQDLVQADVLLVLAQLKKQQFEDALKTSHALEQRMPASPIPYNLTGLAHLAQGDREQAERSFKKALEIDPAFVTAELNLARLAIAAGNLDEASGRYQSVLKKQPGYLAAMLGMAVIAERQGDAFGTRKWLEKAREANPGAMQPALLLVNSYLQSDEPLKALAVARELADKAPQNPATLELLGRAQFAAGETRAAVHSFQRLAELRPDSAQVLLLLGNAQVAAEDRSAARDSYVKALAVAPKFVPARLALAALEFKLGNRGEALRIVKQLQQQEPKLAVAYELEGSIYLADGKLSDAIGAFAQAQELQPASNRVLLLYQAYLANDQPQEALNVLKDWLSQHPDDLRVRGRLAMRLQELGQRDAAIAEYEVITNSVRNVVVLNNLAWLYHEQGDPKAAELAKQAYDLAPDRPEIADTYGWILLNSGDVNRGLNVLQQALVSFPTNPEIAYHVAVGLEKNGRPEEARSLLRRLLDEHPEFNQAAQAKALLSRLGG